VALYSVQAQDCNTGQVLSPITKECVNCTAFLPGCAECNSATNCTTCLSGFNKNENGTCIEQVTCPPGNFKDSSSNCQNCGSVLNNCMYCENGTACIICQDGYTEYNGKCVSVQQQTCDPGLYYDIESGQCKNCTDVIPRCEFCSSKDFCTGCQIGSKLSNGTCSEIQAAQCESNEYLNNETNTCYECNASLENCLECSDGITCTKCDNNTVLLHGACYPPEETCAPGKYLDSQSNDCKNCSDSISNCLICNNGNECTICNNGTTLQNGKCQSSRLRRMLQDTVFGISGNALCPANYGYYQKGGDCYSCPSPCKTCKEVAGTFVCLACDDDSYREGLTCKRCDSSICHCDSCLTSGFCMSCEDGYYSSGINSCKPCRDAMLGCTKCANEKACTECEKPFVLNKVSKKCECARPNCEYCIKEYDGCLKCKKGYTRNSKGKCVSCHKTCAECDDTGINKCSKCGPNAQLLTMPGESLGYCVCIPGYDFDWKLNKCVKV